MLVEALNNVVEHAYLEQPGNTIDIELSLLNGNTRIRITDTGIAAPGTVLLDGLELPNAADLPEGGWGLCLIQALADTIEYYHYPNHNQLVLTKSTTQ